MLKGTSLHGERLHVTRWSGGLSSIDLQGRTHLGIPALTQAHLMPCSTAGFALPAASLPIPALWGALVNDQ